MTKQEGVDALEAQRQAMLDAIEAGAQGHIVILRAGDHEAVLALTLAFPKIAGQLHEGARLLIEQISLPAKQRRLHDCCCLMCAQSLHLRSLGAMAILIVNEMPTTAGICLDCAGEQAADQLAQPAAERIVAALHLNVGVAAAVPDTIVRREKRARPAPASKRPVTHALRPSLCHKCGEMLIHTSVCLEKKARAPMEGDLALCLHCGGVHILHADTWVAPTAAETANFGPDITDRLYNFEEKRRAYRERVPDLDTANTPRGRA
jgi:hypothetical protein